VAPPGFAAPGVQNAFVAVAVVSGVAEVVSCVAGPAGYFVAVVVAGPEVFFVLDLSVPEPVGVFVAAVFVVPVSVADISGHRAFVDIALAFDISVPVSVVAAEVDSSGHPRFFVFPNTDCYPKFSNSVGVVC